MALWVRSRQPQAEPTGRRRLIPPPRVLIAAILLVLLANVLLVDAYADSRFAPDGQRQVGAGQHGVPAAVLAGGPIVDPRHGQLRSHWLPPRVIALTFDDGPDPRWTAAIMRVLRRHGVQATFFVVGAQVARHPDLTHRLVTEGHELGVHTFTHPRLAALPAWRRRLEYAQTQTVIAHAAGRRTSLLRPPYSSGVDSLDGQTWPLVREAGRLGFVTVFNDTDSLDWQRPGVEAIVRASTPVGDRGAIVLLHDAGGDRSQTVAALARLIPQLKAKGYQFTTVSEAYRRAAELDAASSATLGGPSRRPELRGAALVWAVQAAQLAVNVLWVLLFVVGLLTLLRTVLLLVLALRHARRRRSPGWSWGPAVTEGVSVIVPAYNEKEGIAATVRALADSDHGEVEVVVVDDASTDGTAAIVKALRLPNVRVVRIPPGGKATALNTGIALSRHDIIVMVDGDTIVEPDAIREVVQPFADPTVGAVAGNVKVGNRGSVLGTWQHIEYVIGFSLDRRLYETLLRRDRAGRARGLPPAGDRRGGRRHR